MARPRAPIRSRGRSHDRHDRAAAKDFFLGRPLDVIEGQGSDPYEFDFAMALDTKNGLIFGFVWNLAD